jgi:hypothetical protein
MPCSRRTGPAGTMQLCPTRLTRFQDCRPAELAMLWLVAWQLLQPSVPGVQCIAGSPTEGGQRTTLQVGRCSPSRQPKAAHNSPTPAAFGIDHQHPQQRHPAARQAAVVSAHVSRGSGAQPSLLSKTIASLPGSSACQDGKKRRLAGSVSVGVRFDGLKRAALSPLGNVQRSTSAAPWQLRYGENVPHRD